MTTTTTVGPETATLPVINRETSSVIFYNRKNPLQVWMMRCKGKHNGRLVLCGGKRTGELMRPRPGQIVIVGTESREDTARREGPEELRREDGEPIDFTEMRLFCISADRNRDIRIVTIGKATDKLCSPNEYDLLCEAHYGITDYVFSVPVDGVLVANEHDGVTEASEVCLVDISQMSFPVDPAQSPIGAQHDVPLDLLRKAVRSEEFFHYHYKAPVIPDFPAYRAANFG